MRRSLTPALLGANDRLDGFMSDLTLDQLRGTALMGYILTDPTLRRRYDILFEAMLPAFGILANECVVRRRAGEPSLTIAAQYALTFTGLVQGARLMKPSFPQRDLPTDSDLALLFELQRPGHSLAEEIVELHKSLTGNPA